MAGLTLTLAAASLKDDYQPVMREQLNNSFMILQQIEGNSDDVEGKNAVLSLHVRRNSGVGARAEGGTLPTAGNQGTVEERTSLRFNYGRIQVSGQTIKAMRSDKGSWVRSVDSETKGVVADLQRDVNRQIFGTSDGVIAATTNGASSTTVTLAATTTDAQMRQIEEGMLVDIGDTSPFTSLATAREVSAIDFDARTFVISGAAIDTTTSSRVVRSGAGGSGASQKELTGLQSIVDDSGELFGVNPSTYSIWKSKVLGNSGTNRAASENLFAKAVMQGEINGGVTVSAFVTSDGVHRNYAAQLQGQKRTNDTLDLKGGYKAISITAGTSGQVGLTWDRDCPGNKAFGLSFPHLKQHKQTDWEWMDDDGAILSRVSGTDAYEATLFQYHELTTDKRNAHVLVEDLTES